MKRKVIRHKAFTFVLAVIMVISLMPAGALSAFADEVTTMNLGITPLETAGNVPYVNAAGTAQTPRDATVVVDQTAWDTNENDGWYVVTGDVTINSRITVNGTVNLILADSGNLTAEEGINVSDGNSLTIWGQTGGTGQLTATGDTYNAGIGGGDSESGGTITISGGTVNAQGGSLGAGIGGGNFYGGGGDFGDGGTINITGGTIEAQGGSGGAGIGGGNESNGGTINITGGMIEVQGGRLGAGIGGGVYGNGGTIIISGGTVNAQGGEYGAGIGHGDFWDGANRDGGTITIHGGMVTATGGAHAKDIGNRQRDEDDTVTINGGSVNATHGLVSPAPTNGNENVYLNTLLIGSDVNANMPVTAGSIGGTVCDAAQYNETSHADLSGYGIYDVVTDDAGKVYFWLPATTDEETVALSANDGYYSESYIRTADNTNAQTLTLKTLISAQIAANGAANTQDTTQLKLTFSRDVTDLSADKITISNGSGTATKGSLSRSGTTYTLDVSDVSAGNISVAIADFDDYIFSNSPVSVTVHKGAKTPENQAAPAAFNLIATPDRGARNYTVEIPVAAAGKTEAEYSFDGKTWSNARTTTAKPGDTVTGYVRYGASALYNASAAVSHSVTLALLDKDAEQKPDTEKPDVTKPDAKKTFTVGFHTNGGKALKKALKPRTVTKGKAIGKLPQPVRKNYNFKGWYTKKTGGAKVTAKTKVTKNMTLYAHWQKKVKYGKVVNATAVYVRAYPSAGGNTSGIAGHLQKGATFKIIKFIDNKGTDNDWYTLKYKGKTAYIYARYVEVMYR